VSQFDLRLGDCIEVLRSLPAESVDAVVTDPPYGLSKEPDIAEVMRHWLAGDRYEHGGSGFMGKSWDSFVPGPEYWREAFRVLRPGAHVLAFAGTRTVDLMAVALRFAGFEIRDQLAWVYGSGFPKSVDVSKMIDKAMVRDRETGALVFRGHVEEIYAATTEIADLRDLAGVSNREIDELFGTNGMAGHWTARRTNTQPQIPQWDEWAKIKALFAERFRAKADDIFTDWSALDRLSKLDAAIWKLNGRKGKPGDGWFERPITGEHAQPAAAQAWQVNCGVSDVAVKGDRRDEAATEEARRWQGWGSALKPAQEPIILARKPLAGTIAATVLRHGTGAINVDACRIGTSDDLNGGGYSGGGPTGMFGLRHLEPEQFTQPSGRWPANFLLSHGDGCELVGTKRVRTGTATAGDAKPGHLFGFGERGPEPRGHADDDGREEVEDWRCAPGCPVAELDRQSGETTSTASVSFTDKPNFANKVYGRGMGGTVSPSNQHEDSGGASRFFYVAKPDGKERDLGLEGLPKKSRAEATDRAEGSAGAAHARAGAGSREGRANIHPTVKPVDLMRWLCRLVTPPGGVVLDPFMGSGSTGVACSREGFRFLGIERDPAYYKIAEHRLIGDSPLFNRLTVRTVVDGQEDRIRNPAESVDVEFSVVAPTRELATHRAPLLLPAHVEPGYEPGKGLAIDRATGEERAA
jgi:DNA modification methylase